MLICDKCGTAAEKGKFCKVCGGPLRDFFTVKQTSSSSVVLTCTKCGKESSDGKYCIFCGGELAVARQQEASSPANNTPVPVSSPAEKAESKPSGLVCSKCGKEFEKGKFCTVCGGNLVPAAGEEKPAEQASAPVPTPVPVPSPVNAPTPASNEVSAEVKSSGLVCSKCGKEFEKGKFCTVCGGDLVPAGGADKPAEQASAPLPTPVPSSVNTPTPAAPVGSAEAKSSGLVCSKCGKEFEKGKFCTVCGGDLVPAGGADKPAEQASTPLPTSAPSPVPAPVNAPVSDIPAPTPSGNAAVKNTASEFGKAVENAVNCAPGNSAAPASGKLVCEGCGKEFEKGKFCTVCGGNLIPAGGNAPAAPTVPPVAPPPVSAPSQNGNLRCTSCGNIMSKGKFCTVCGGNLAPITGAPAPTAPASQGLHCPQCGKTFPQGKFCTVCGIPLVN